MPILRLLSVVLAAHIAAGCAVPHTVIPSAPGDTSKPAPIPLESGFLADYSRLQATEQFPELKIYRDVGRKTGYRKIRFRPVEIWRGTDKRLQDVSEEDLQYLADAFYQSMQKELSESFELVKKPSPGVLEIHLALTLVTTPEASIDFFSTEVPVKDLSRREGPLAPGTRRFMRDCALEAEFTEVQAGPDPKKGERRPRKVRAAVFDVRRGTDTSKGTVSTWDDVHAVFERWADVLDERLEALRDGTYKPKLTIQRQ